MYAGKAGANPSEATFMCSTLGKAPGLIHKDYTSLERLARNKHSILLRTLINRAYKKFYNIGPRDQCYKTFYGRKLQLFVIS
jgi:hypothetical protein